MIFLVGLIIIIACLFFLVVTKRPTAKTQIVTGRGGFVSFGTLEQIRKQITTARELKTGGKPSQLKQAIIEIDKGLQLALGEIAPNRPFPEQMKIVRNRLSEREDVEQLSNGHKIRNLIVHEINEDLPSTQLTQAIETYAAGLEKLIRT
jgi:hypothetical protein